MRLARRSFGSMVLRGLTPMLDALFILLFALLALSDSRQIESSEEVRIQLPSVEPGDDSEPAPFELFSILVDAESVVRLEGSLDSTGSRGVAGTTAPIASFDELDAALAERLGAALPEDVAIDIVADENARHGVMVELLQHLRLRGFVRVQLLATGTDTDGAFARGGER